MLSCMQQPNGFYRRVLHLAIPVLLQNLITTSLGFMDTFMVGLLGSEEMSAVTIANVPIFIIQLLVFGLQSGSSVLISQFWGKGDRASINRVLGIGFFVAGGASMIFAVVMCAFPAQVLWLISDNARLVALGVPYIQLVGFSYVFNSISSIYIGMQRSIENPKFGMSVFAVSMCCNTVGNYILIFGKFGAPMLGIRGAALATLLARVIEFVICAVYALRCRAIPLQFKLIARPGRDILHSFVKYSAPVLLNETLWGLGTSMYTVIMGHMAISAEILAAYTIAGNIDKMMTVSMFGVAAATAVIVGKEIGMGNGENVLSIGKALSVIALGVGLCMSVLYLILFPTVLRPLVLPLFHLSPTESAICTTFIFCYAAAAPLHSFMTTAIVGVMRGGGDVKRALLADIAPLWCFTIPALALAGLVLDAPVWLFCLVLTFEPLLKVPIALPRLLGGKWVHNVTAAK